MRRSLTPFESLRRDRDVYEALSSEAASRRKFPRAEHLEAGKKGIAEYLEHPPGRGERPTGVSDRMAEAIILVEGRPTLLIQNNTFEQAHLEIWQDRLERHRTTLNRVIPSVGRVEVVRHPDFEWLGTAWVVDDRVLVTNRHVASLFARKQGGAFAFIRNPFGETVGAKIDFREEFQVADVAEIEVEEVLFIAEPGTHHPDIAFLRLKQHADIPAPLELASADAKPETAVAVIGYPAFDTRNSGVPMSRLFQDIFDVKRLAPGFVTFDQDPAVFEHDCTTLGGNSGSPVVELETGHVVGLHFSGRFGVANFAVNLSTIKRTLASIGRTPTRFALGLVDEERRMSPADYVGREGYDERFLGSESRFHVPLPNLTTAQLDDAVPVTGAGGRGLSRYVLDYRHFSVVMCKSRRLAYFTAVNIDGTQEVLLRRKSTTWKFDGRIPEQFQIGNDAYVRNKLDRGHLVRRLDPVWGTDEQAKEADDDTFHYTNAAPQHERLNQRNWLALEDHLLRNTNNRDMHISVFTGPVFRDCDVLYRGVRVPEEFWKVVVMVTPAGEPHCTAYLLSQREMLDDLEFQFGAFRTYQTPVHRIEAKTGLDFGRLKDFDPLAGTEAREGSPSLLLEDLDNIVI